MNNKRVIYNKNNNNKSKMIFNNKNNRLKEIYL